MNETTEEHVCEDCGKTFGSEAELQRHVREVGLVAQLRENREVASGCDDRGEQHSEDGDEHRAD